MDQTQLYFWRPLIEKLIQEITIVDEYYRRTKPQFENIENEAEEYAREIYENYPSTEDVDQSSVAEFAQERSIELYETLALMKSNHLHMTISMLYHIWEQQIIKFCINELRGYIRFEKNALDYTDAKLIFKEHGIDFEKTASWKKIKELKALVNTIKHGDGSAADNLRKIRPDFFQLDFLEGTDTLELHGSVLLDEYSLQVQETDFYDYLNALKEFWEKMPERAYADTEELLKKLNSSKKKK